MSKCAIQGGVDQLEEYVDYNILAGHLSEAS